MVKKLEAELMDDARQAVGTHLEYGMTKVQQEVGAIRKDLERQQTSLAAEIASRVLGRDVKASEVRP
jgi:F-type H+-transporting ATPase subunit b